jgi:hypothetical protein
MYHVDLDLAPGEVKDLKRRALDESISVKELVTRLVRRELPRRTDPEPRKPKS